YINATNVFSNYFLRLQNRQNNDWHEGKQSQFCEFIYIKQFLVLSNNDSIVLLGFLPGYSCANELMGQHMFEGSRWSNLAGMITSLFVMYATAGLKEEIQGPLQVMPTEDMDKELSEELTEGLDGDLATFTNSSFCAPTKAKLQGVLDAGASVVTALSL
ncbi:hypothetical protein ACJX0J_031501, partial [Zea mays]